MRIPSFKEVKGFLAEASRQALEPALYNLGIAAYAAGVRIASVRNPKARKMVRGHKETLARIRECIGENDRTVWFHAASLGEFEQGRPLMERIRKAYPDIKILLSFFSPSGYEVRKNYEGADCVVYLPFDTPRNVRHFLYAVNPEMAFFVKYEVWRNYLRELNRRAVPTYLISAVFRPEQKFFKKATAWYGLWLKWFTKIFVQDFRSRSLLKEIGIDNVEVAGDTRFDRVVDIRAMRKDIPEINDFIKADGDKLVFMAGSSWPEDEKVYGEWVNRHPEVKVVIAPHEFDTERLEAMKRMSVNGAVLLSELKSGSATAKGKQVLIIDCFGLLSSAYQYCDIAYVGGGFGAGLHNINEAAVYGVPVIYGPNHEKFIEAKEMASLGAGIPVNGKEGFEMRANRLLYDTTELHQRGEWATQYINEKTGASDKIFNNLFVN